MNRHASQNRSAPLRLRDALLMTLALAALAVPLVAQAQVRPATTVVPTSGGTTAYVSPNGVPVVNINAANGAGVSHNVFTRYDVQGNGLVLNNGNTSQAARQSQLAGQVLANPNLLGEARVIINEVSSTGRSTLAGFTEVLGGRADVIVANPNGITCTGCGFINSDRVTLTTGTPRLGGDGSLSGFTVNRGDILVNGAGLNGSAQQVLDLVSRSVRLDATVNAPDLGLFTGNNLWNYGTREVSGATPGSGPAPSYAIDSSALGGMYAGRIRLIATEAGVGVHMLGEAAASGSDFSLSAAGRIDVRGNVSAERDLSLSSTDVAADAIRVTDSALTANNNLSVSAAPGGASLSGGVLIAGRDLSLSLGTLTDTTSGAALQDNNRRYAGGNLLLAVGQAAGIGGTRWGTAGAFDATIGGNFSHAGLWHASGDLTLSAARIDNTATGGLAANGNLSVRATGGAFDNHGALYAGAALTASSTGTFTNHGRASGPEGTIDAGGAISISAPTFVNQSTIQGAQDISIEAATFRNNVFGDLTRQWTRANDSGVVFDNETSGWCVPCAYNPVRRYYHQTWDDVESFVGFDTNTAKPQILAGHGSTLSISGFTSGTNNGGVLSAGTVVLRGASPQSTFVVDPLILTTLHRRRDWNTEQRWYGIVGAAASSGTMIENDSGDYTVNNSVSAFGAGVFGNHITLSNADLTLTGSTLGSPTLNTPPGPNVTLPTNPNGYFVASHSPNAQYLVETNPLFSAGSNFLGSNYLAELLGFNPDTVEKRLGDANYEAYLIRQQLIAQTGSNILKGQVAEAPQIKSLMDGAVSQGESLGLTWGQPLTAAQVGNLKQDMVWMVETTVAGQKVLAPVVYLSAASRSSIDGGAVIAGKNVNLNLASLNNLGGTLKATDTMTIVAAGDIRNTAGSISADNLALVSTGGKVVNSTTVNRLGSVASGNYQDVAGPVGAISAKNNLVVSGSQGVDVIGATVSAGQSAVLHSDKGDINVRSLVLETKASSQSSRSDFFSSHSESRTETNQTLQQASVGAGTGTGTGTGGNAALTLLAEKGSVNVAGADLASSGAINVKARDVNFSTVELNHSRSERSQSSGISASGGALSIGSSSTSHDETSSKARGTQVSAQGALNIQADRDITLEGGQYRGKTVSLEAGQDVITKAAANRTGSKDTSGSAGFSVGNGGIGFSSERKNRTERTLSHTNAQIGAADGVAIVAKGKLDIGGLDAAVANKAAPAPTPSPDSGAANTTASAAPADAAAPKAQVALGLDVLQLTRAAEQGTAGQHISQAAGNGLGASEAVATMAQAAQGQLSLSGAQIVSTKYRNELEKSSESASTSARIGATQGTDQSSPTQIGLSIQDSYSKTTAGEKKDQINRLSADSVALNASKGIDLQGVAIEGGSSVSLKSNGDIRISAAEVEKTATLDSRNTRVGLGVSANEHSVSANLNIGHESTAVTASARTHQDATLQSGGTLSIQSQGGDVRFTGVTATADTLAVKAQNFSAEAYKDSSARTENNTKLGVNLTLSIDPGQIVDDLFKGNGALHTTLDRKETAELGNTLVANKLTIDAQNAVTLTGGQVVADQASIKAHTVDIKAAASTLEERKTEVGISLTADGSAALMGNKARASIDSMTGQVDAGTSHSSELAERTGAGRVNDGKAVSDEMLTAKVGLTITAKEESTSKTSHDNASIQFKNLSIDTQAAAGSTQGDGHVDVGGANLLSSSKDSSLRIVTGELKTTKYVDKSVVTSHDNSTFVGVATEAHSAVADTVNHSKTLADKQAQGMKVDAGWAAAQAAADATNMAMGDAIGGSASATVRNVDTRSRSEATSENTTFINAGSIDIKTTSGDLTLNGVQFGAPPVLGKDGVTVEKSLEPRPTSITLDAAKDIRVAAAKSTSSQASTTLTTDVNLTLAGSISGSGSGVGIDAGNNGSTQHTETQQTRYANAQVSADTVTLKAQNLSLVGANVSGGNVRVEVANNVAITSVQDTQTQKGSRANWGGSVGLNTLTLVSVNGQGGGGDSHDNHAKTAQQSGITAQSNLSVKAGGNLSLTGASLASAGGGSVQVKGNVIANKLDDSRERDGLFAGGSAGISQGGLNAGVNLEKVDQVHQASTQNATISGVALQVGGKLEGNNLQPDGRMQSQTETVLKDERIAGVYVNGTGARHTARSDKPTETGSLAKTPTVADTALPPMPAARNYESVVVLLPANKAGGAQDKVAQDAGQALYDRNEDKNRHVVLVQEQADGSLAVVKGNLSTVSGPTKVEVVSHGKELKGRAEEVAGMVRQLDELTPAASFDRVNVNACATCNKQGDKSFGQELSGALAGGRLKGTEVAEYSPGTKLHVDAAGNKLVKNERNEATSTTWKASDGASQRVGETPLATSRFDDAVALRGEGDFLSAGLAMRFPGGRDFKVDDRQEEVREPAELREIYKDPKWMRSKYKGAATERDRTTKQRATTGIPISGKRNELPRAGWSEGHIELAQQLTAALRAETHRLHSKAENSHALGHGDFGVDHFLSAPPASRHQNTEQLAMEVAMRLAALDLGPNMIRLKITDAIDPKTGALQVRRYKIIRRLDPNLDWNAPGNTKIAVDRLMDGKRASISKDYALKLSHSVYDSLMRAQRSPENNYTSRKHESQRGLNRDASEVEAPTVAQLKQHAESTLAHMQGNKARGEEFDRAGVRLSGPAFTDLTVSEGGVRRPYHEGGHVAPEEAAVRTMAKANGWDEAKVLAFLKTKHLAASEQDQIAGVMISGVQSLNAAVAEILKNGTTVRDFMLAVAEAEANTPATRQGRSNPHKKVTDAKAALENIINPLNDAEAILASYGLNHDILDALTPDARAFRDALNKRASGEATGSSARRGSSAMEEVE